jgi:hypothetical protein
MGSLRGRPRGTMQPGFLRLPGVDIHGAIAGIAVADPDDGAPLVGRVLRLYPDEPAPRARDLLNGLLAVAGWPVRRGRYEIPVAVQAGDRDQPLRLTPLGEPELRQDRSALRVAVAVPSRVWWMTPARVHRASATTVNVSANGLAIALPRLRPTDGSDHPKPGAELGAVVELPDGPLACATELVGRATSVGRDVARLRIIRCRRADLTRLARFVIQTEARRG